MTIVERNRVGCTTLRVVAWSPAPAYPQIGRGRARVYCASRTMKWLSKSRFISGAGPGKLLTVVFASGPPALATYLSEPLLSFSNDAVSRRTSYARTIQVRSHPSLRIAACAGRLDLDDCGSLAGSTGSGAIHDRPRNRNGNGNVAPACAAEQRFTSAGRT